MDDIAGGPGVVRYSTTPGWWVPALLDLLALPALVRSGALQWWAIDVVAALIVLAVLYVLTHPRLSFSPESFSLRRGPMRTTVDLRSLAWVRATEVARRTNVLDPQTGDRRSVIRWYRTSPDDWAGKTPTQGYVIEDGAGRRLVLDAVRSGGHRWVPYIQAALKEQPDVELGPRVMESLKDFAR